MEKIAFASDIDGEVTLAVIGEMLSQQTVAILSMLEVQQELLRAVQEIQVGDEVIGEAMSRYQQKWAVVNGGLK